MRVCRNSKMSDFVYCFYPIRAAWRATCCIKQVMNIKIFCVNLSPRFVLDFRKCVVWTAVMVVVSGAYPEIIPADRLPVPGTWESAGVEGGIPNRNTIFATVTEPPYNADNTGISDAGSAIQNAINECPAGQVVYVPPGTYSIGSSLTIRKSITLRGAGAETIFKASTGRPISIGRLGPWPPPKNNPAYYMDIANDAVKGTNTVNVEDTSSLQIGKMIMIDELDDPDLVWTKSGRAYRFRASMHMVESKTANSVTFRPALPISYTRSPHLAYFPDIVQDAGVESIKFVGDGTYPNQFITIYSAWNVWVYNSEFTNMPAKTIMVAWSGHVELRRNYLSDQADGGPNSEALDLFADVNWSKVVDNICVAAGFPQINIGDFGSNANYSGGFGNVIAYNYAVDSFYTDPPTASNHGIMTADIGSNHSPHSQFNLFEGNWVGKFGADAYHGGSSHNTYLRNVATGQPTSWTNATHRIAISIDRRNLYYNLIGNVFGDANNIATHEYAVTSSWSGSTIYRLGFPNVGNNGFDGEHPPVAIPNSDGGPRDLYVDRNDTPYGTTILEGNWSSVSGKQSWTISPESIAYSYYLSEKPDFFGDLAWPPVDPANPVTDDPTIIPAAYRYINGEDPPGVSDGATAPATPKGLRKVAP